MQDYRLQVYPLKGEKSTAAGLCYVIEELITEKSEVLDKEAYYNAIVNTIIDIGRAEDFIIALAELIQRLVVDHLHILGISMTGGQDLTLLWTGCVITIL